MTVSYETYMKDKKAFFEEHKYNFQCDTSPMDEYGAYHKTYIFDDHAVWYESMTPTYEKAKMEVKMVRFDVEVKLLRTEYWSTDHSESKYYYEKY